MKPAREVFLHRQLGEGHVTISAFVHPGGKLAEIGIALCSPTDNFSRVIGRAIASGRRAKSPRFSVEATGDHVSMSDIETCFADWFSSNYCRSSRDWLRAAADALGRRQRYGVSVSLQKRAQ